jgi:DNA-binding response OmpR family regulator
VRILIVEDEPKLARRIADALHDADYISDVAPSCGDAHMHLAAMAYEAIVLDLGLPDGDGLDVVRSLRARGSHTGVLALTARDSVQDRVAGLDAGADDYLVKPFAMIELLARVRALLRRPGAVLGRRLTAGNIDLDAQERSVLVDGKPVTLPRRELEILEVLLRRMGRLVTRESLMDQLYAETDDPPANAIPVHVHHLRRHLTDAGATASIVTLRGLGYMLKAGEPS